MSAEPGDIVVSPNPVQEGDEIEIDFQGTGPIKVSVDLGEQKEIPVDPKTGKARFKVPIGARVVVVSDGEGGRVQVEVISRS